MTTAPTTVLLVSAHDDPAPWRRALANHLPEAEVRVWPDDDLDPGAVDVALVWKPPPGLLASFPNLKAVINLGAGVDALLGDETLPENVALARLVDPLLTAGMTEYVVHGVLHFHRAFPAMAAAQAARRWEPVIAPHTAATGVGILGLGELGQNAAHALVALGFDVAGWSRRPKTLPGVKNFVGRAALDDFLARSRILVCLLPLTADTEGILNAGLFAKLPPGATLINAGRGGHLVEEDVIPALDAGVLDGAMLDVFRHEPLPTEHPFWGHPKIIVTPHIASLTVAKSAAPRLADSIRRVMAGKPPLDLIDRNAGY